MLSFLRPWLFLFIIILGEMLQVSRKVCIILSPTFYSRIISYTLNVLNFLLGYEFHLRFSVRKGFILNLLYVNVIYQRVILLSFANI